MTETKIERRETARARIAPSIVDNLHLRKECEQVYM